MAQQIRSCIMPEGHSVYVCKVIMIGKIQKINHDILKHEIYSS